MLSEQSTVSGIGEVRNKFFLEMEEELSLNGDPF